MATALSTDLYELTMMAGYYVAGMTGRASFELYVRELPPNRSFLVTAGLEQALDYLESLRFRPDEIEYLRLLPNVKRVPRAFFDELLPRVRFTGEVWAVAEGTPLFPHEPFLRVTAPIMEAQLVETALVAFITFQTTIASKAARVVEAAAGRPVAEFGSRRAHGTEAAMYAARAAYLAGCASTSNVEAGFRFGIPVSGTMAHSWVMSFADELESFRQYAALYGEASVFLIDTYDSVEAARRIAASGLRPGAVRIDSGEVVPLSREVRRVLDEGGLTATRIFVSGDLDERKIVELLADGAVIDGVGVGTALSTSNDAPALGGIYKLVEIERDGKPVPTLKRSPGKASYPGCKQVWRTVRDGRAAADVLALDDEPPIAGAMPLLQPVMARGRRLAEPVRIGEMRERAMAAIAALPPAVRRLDRAETYPVRVSQRLEALTRQLSQVV
jgi:nicotinate phosphoribosyltransferase